MIDRKEKILNAALELFANEGYSATSTSRIGKKAGVSEGLIFRHFKNKKELLNAIMDDAEHRTEKLILPILNEDDPKRVIKKTLEIPFTVPKSEYDFWKLLFKLKWEVEYNKPQRMKPLIDKLTAAFAELKYEHPEYEALLLNQILDAVSTEILQGNLENEKQFKNFLMKRYSLS